jgi:hypothetical protein
MPLIKFTDDQIVKRLRWVMMTVMLFSLFNTLSGRQFMNVQTTLNFYGRTEEAVKFYCRTIEAETLFMMRFRDCPDPSQLRPGMEEKIFHATFRIGSTEIMASDCGCEKPPPEQPLQASRFFSGLTLRRKPNGSSRPSAMVAGSKSLW